MTKEKEIFKVVSQEGYAFIIPTYNQIDFSKLHELLHERKGMAMSEMWPSPALEIDYIASEGRKTYKEAPVLSGFIASMITCDFDYFPTLSAALGTQIEGLSLIDQNSLRRFVFVNVLECACLIDQGKNGDWTEWYEFDREILGDRTIFSVPELPFQVFATSDFRNSLPREDLIALEFSNANKPDSR